jgi:hypothetical protein
MCACFFAIFAATAPRLALIFVWIFTPLVNRAFDTILLPILGILFLPYTTLFYVLVVSGGIMGFEWFLLIFGFVIDIASYTGGAFSGKRRFA